MTLAEKKAMVTALVGNDAQATDALVGTLLTKAENAIYRRLYPMGFPETPAVPTEYEMLQCELASRYFFRMGGEGEKSHSENGMARTYDSVNDEDLLCEVMQEIRV